MDIILLCPRDPLVTKNSYKSLFINDLEMVPLGLFYLATSLENNGYRVKIIDLNTIKDSDEDEVIINGIIAQKPKIVGISASTTTYPGAKMIAQKIKTALGNKTVLVWGGLHVTFLPEEPLKEGLADLVVRGEGEFAIIQIAKAFLDNSGSFKDIEGVSFIENNGEIVHNKPNMLIIKDLNTLPTPKRSFIDPGYYKNPGTVISSRGCVARCQFCASGAYGQVRTNAPEKVIEEIVQLYTQYGINQIQFADNTFVTYKKRALEIFNGVKNRGIDARYFIESRASQVNEEFIKDLAAAGVYTIHFGVESGSPEVLKAINKHITLEQVDSAVEICKANGIEVYCSFIIGHPADTQDTVHATIKFAKQLRRKGATCSFYPLTPYPGTEVFNQREELGITILDWDYSRWNFGEPVIKTRNLSKRDIMMNLRLAYAEINSL